MSVAVLEPYENESDDDDDKDKLWTCPSAESQETPTDVQVSADLNDLERQEVRNLVNEFPDVSTDKPGYIRVGYNLDIMLQSACLVLNPITVYSYGFLFKCTTVGQASDSMTALS